MEPILSDGCVDLENFSPWKDVDICAGPPFTSLYIQV